MDIALILKIGTQLLFRLINWGYDSGMHVATP
jgi:hypothetical protein